MTSAKMELDNISFAYDSALILKGLSLFIQESDFIGLIGPNGSGKSTLLKIMGGILKPDSGYIKFKGSDTRRISKKIFAQSVSWISQGHPMVFPFKVSEVVLMGRHPHLSALSLSPLKSFSAN